MHNHPLLSTQLSTISENINGLGQSLTDTNSSDKLVTQLTIIAEKLHAIEQVAGSTISEEASSKKFTEVVTKMQTMNEELAKISEASVKKANWLTEIRKRSSRRDS